MPLAAVNTHRDLICYEYARLIAAAADMERDDGFVMDRMRKLESGDIRMCDVVGEARDRVEAGFETCIYCGSAEDLTPDHLIPVSDGAPDVTGNRVPACRACTDGKGDRDVITWYRERDARIPRFIWGRFLHLTYETCREEGILDDPLSEDELEKWTGLDVDRSIG